MWNFRTEKTLPKIYNALEIEYEVNGQPNEVDARSATASWRKLGPLHRNVFDGRVEARNERNRYWRSDHRTSRRSRARSAF